MPNLKSHFSWFGVSFETAKLITKLKKAVDRVYILLKSVVDFKMKDYIVSISEYHLFS